MIKLSVLVTFCKQKDFIQRALDSIFMQKTDFEYEVLIGLDGECAESEQIINSYCEKHHNAHLHKIDNSGIDIINIEKASKNRLNLLARAQGKYICFLDGDDCYCSDKRFQTLVDILDDNYNIIAVCHDYKIYDYKTGTYTSRKHKFGTVEQLVCAKDYIIKPPHLQYSCWIYRNIFLGTVPNDFNSRFLNDSTFIYYRLKYGDFYYVPDEMLAYTINIQSIYNSLDNDLQLAYAFLASEENYKTQYAYHRELCKKYKKNLKKLFKLRNKIQKHQDCKKIINFAKEDGCYFTYSILNYNNLSLISKVELMFNMFLYYYFNWYKLDIKVKKLLYFNGVPNFGDQLNLYVIQRLLNIQIRKEKASKCDLLAIGSYLQQIIGKKKKQRTITIWGTGFIKPVEKKRKIKLTRNIKVLALRGKLSVQELQKFNVKNLGKVPLGDSGLLSSYLYQIQPSKKYKVGIILHYVDKNSVYIKNIKLPDYKLIDVNENPMWILKEISECDVIFSSAMHGLIAADSLNIPNQQIILSNKIVGGLFKYKDYYSIFAETPNPIDLRKRYLTEDDVISLKNNYRSDNKKEQIKMISKRLLDCAKYI